MNNFAGKKTFVQYIDFINLGFSESNMLAEIGNKALRHNFDMLNSKILVQKLDLHFNALICIKQKYCRISNFTRRRNCANIF